MSSTTSPTPRSSIDLKTLWITAASSAAAAYVTSKLWSDGTLAAAAFTPVLVALLREGLAKSTDVVTKVVPVKGVVRSTRPDGTQEAVATPDWGAADLAAEASLAGPELAEDPAMRVAQPGEISYHGGRGKRARNWRVAIITGLLGFLIAAVVFTVPELVAGKSAAGGGRDTTLFGGKQRDSRTPVETTTTSTEPANTVTAEPQPTVTVPPPTVTTPPATTTPVPQQQTTTPAPAETTATPPPAEEPLPQDVPPG